LFNAEETYNELN